MNAAAANTASALPAIVVLPRRGLYRHYSLSAATLREGWTYKSLRQYTQLRARHLCALERDRQWLEHLRDLQAQVGVEQAAKIAFRESMIQPETLAALEAVVSASAKQNPLT